MGKKTYYVHLEWEGYPEKTSKLSIPGKWETKPLSALIELFADAYNSKNPDKTVDISVVHLESQNDGQGDKFYSDSIIGEVLESHNDYYITPGVYITPEKTLPSTPKMDKHGVPLLRCKNYGCQQYYSESENSDDACHHHTKPPYFHDTVKGWQCCRDIKAFDWEEFQAIKGCVVSRHSTEDPGIAIALSDREQAGQELAAERAAAGSGEAGAMPPVPPLRSVEGFNAANPDAATAAGGAAKILQAPRKSSRTEDGLSARCQRKGCGVKFLIENNAPGACRYHAGQPVFHDAMKYWSCCADQKKMDFDEFMAVPGCAIGYHDDGVIELAP